MSRSKWFFLVTAIVLMAGTAGALNWLRANQKLGPPGIKAAAIPGSVVMEIALPENVLDCTSDALPQAEVVTNMLPKDTSFAQRRYTAPDGFWVTGNIVLMGADRTSIHKPEYCLPGQGWTILEKGRASIPIAGAPPYELTVAKWVLGNTFPTKDGRSQEVRAVYVFWFVAHNEQTTDHWQRIWWLARDLLTTGVLQRWAYVSYFTAVEPGQEAAAYERVQKVIAASVPEFQLPLTSARAGAVAGP
jgi:hypothetical protein